MPHNKKQHFVPQLLQRFFSIDKENIGSFHIKSGRVGPSPIAKTAQKDWLYKVNKKDRTSIEHIFEHIERNAQPIIERIQHKDFTLSSEEINKLFIFVVAQLMRTPKAAIAMGAVLDFCIQNDIKEVCKEVEDGIRDMSNLPMQASIAIPKVAEHLSGKRFLFVCNDTNVKFLLSDNPACIFSPVAEVAEDKHIEYKMKKQEAFSGYMLYLPLGPTVGIICFDDDYYDFSQSVYIDATPADVKTLNRLEVISASHIIMHLEGTFSQEEIAEALAERNTERCKRYQTTIYTPIDKSFSLTGLNLDENILVYKINKYAIVKNGQETQ